MSNSMNQFHNVQELFQSFTDTVLLVGNGTIQEKGSLIDSYDTVVRFNDFVIDGYEIHVGTKISAIGFASINLSKSNAKHLLHQYNKYIDIVPIFSLNETSRDYTGRMLGTEVGTSLVGMGRPLYGSTYISTGVATATSLALFFNKEVHLIGFDFLRSGHYWEKDHEHSDSHNSDIEQNIISSINSIKIL